MNTLKWPDLLFDLSLVITVGADVVVLYYSLAAFRRTKQIAFLLLTFSCGLDIIISVYDHTIGSQVSRTNHYIVFTTIRRFTYFATTVLWAAGTVLLTRAYLNSFRFVKSKDESAGRTHC
jgi:hypothetical protein